MKQNLVDQAEFSVKAGDGGDGAVSFRRQKYVPKGGPDGGHGGRGGNIYLETDPHLTTLRFYAGKHRFEAIPGERGGKQNQSGADAADLVLKVPVGTQILINRQEFNLRHGRPLYGSKNFTPIVETEPAPHSPEALNARFDLLEPEDIEDQTGDWLKVADLSGDDDRFLLAYGGAGGSGNAFFKSSTVTTPRFAERGEKGELFKVRLELKVLADLGLVGLPNAGKSTLLSVLTAARPEIADYPFTTLSPNLGVLKTPERSLIIADIPGIIEDAHEGKGLGIKFLRHIERCRLLLYIISPQDTDLTDNQPPAQMAKSLWRQFQTVKHEVEAYGHDLVDKPYLVVINKLDLLSPAQLKAIHRHFKDHQIEILPVSAATTKGIGELKAQLADAYREIT